MNQPQLPQRYGLSVFLRKPYPQLESREWGVGSGEFLTGERAWREIPRDLQEFLTKKATEDAFTAAHLLRTTNVRVVRVTGAGTQDIDLAALAGDGSPTLFLDVAPWTTLTIHEHMPDIQDNASILIMLRAGSGARVSWFSSAYETSRLRIVQRVVFLERDAALNHVSAQIAQSQLRDDMHVVLAEEGAACTSHTLLAGYADNQFDTGVTAEHRAPRTTADIHAKVVLTDKAQAVVRGLVRVEQRAPGSNGYQRCDALLLSKTAEVDPIPNLEIETNDVRCTHGVTVSHVNPEHLFYLQSRGLSDTRARELLVEGFIGDVLHRYLQESRTALEQAIQPIVKGGSA